MSDTQTEAPDTGSLQRLLRAYKAAAAAGNASEADRLLAAAAQLAPGHPAVLNERGLALLSHGQAAAARELLERATAADPGHPALWSNLASSLHALRLPAEELEAIDRALALEPRHLPALLQKAALVEEGGDARGAARIYRGALVLVPPPDVTLPPAVSAALERARAAVRRDDAALAATLEARLGPVRERHGAERSQRADKFIDLFTGKRRLYAPQPTFMNFPELPAIEFFDRADFPWLDPIESATQEIRAELTAVLAADQAGFAPYVSYPAGMPLDQWRELNRSRRWSAYFLWNEGVPQPEHLARCPRTVQLLAHAPLCDVPGHAPNVFFSVLDARTPIPPHTGVTNTRLTVHLPLIVPEGCGFRVGGETRSWVPGRAWVFDDTIEHEAWNRSDTPRAILIFDIWNPYLTDAEREVVRTATEAIGDYYRAPEAPGS